MYLGLVELVLIDILLICQIFLQYRLNQSEGDYYNAAKGVAARRGKLPSTKFKNKQIIAFVIFIYPY
jgi:hypothetical protein